MRRCFILLGIFTIASMAFAIPDDVVLYHLSWVRPEPRTVEVIDEGVGDTAVVFLARKSDFDLSTIALMRATPLRPRVIAILLNGGGLASVGGTRGLTALTDSILKGRGITSSLVITCGDCAEAAAVVVETLKPISGLVLVETLPIPRIEIKKPVFIASNFGQPLSSVIVRVLDMSDQRRRMLRKEGWLEPE